MFYYREIPDPNDPSLIKREYFADDVFDQDDMIYKMSGGILHYDKYKEILDVVGRGMKDTFLDNRSIRVRNFTLKPELEDTPYQDPELARIERDSKPVNVKMISDDPNPSDSQLHIKVEGEYQPEPCVFERMVDFGLLPQLSAIDQHNLQEYVKKEASLSHLTKIKCGMRVKITGRHLRIRPTSTGDHGLFMVAEDTSKNPKCYDLLDFLEVNSNSVLLLSVPKDLPVGIFRLRITSGWYNDPEIKRTGVSPPFELI